MDREALARIVETMNLGVYVWTLEDPADLGSFRLVFANPAAARYSAVPNERILGKTLAEALPGVLATELPARCREALAAGETIDFGEVSYRDERIPEGLLSARAVPLSATTVALLFRDITRQRAERKRLEERLTQSQKLEVVGRLAGGIAHDFNNLLTAILGYANLVAMGLDEHDPLRSSMEEIISAAERAAVLTRQLLAFSRKQVLRPRVIDLNGLIAGLERMLVRVVGEDVRLVTRLAADAGRVEADPGQLEQVLLSLVANARDAMPRGGELAIETSNVDFDPSEAAQQGEARPGRHVRIAVSDTGVGMSRDVLDHLFEPFFTTKPSGAGTGMGLAAVYGVVRQSGGHLTVASEPGRGSVFTIFLPRVEAAVAALAVAERPAPAGGKETILLAEDEDGVRRLLRRLLEEQGYRVLEAASGGEALTVVERHAGSLDLVVTDVVMPGMGGREMVARLLERRPGLRVIYISGYTDEAVLQHGVLTPGTAFLEKPFSPAELALLVRRVLDAEA
jgi:signal transduction histidine kinase/CheY-like chemotaxis protein